MGKTTLPSVLSSFRRQTAGAVLVDGEEPFENRRTVRGTAFVRESGDVVEGSSVKDALDFAARLRPYWDESLAAELTERFELAPTAKVDKLSRGKKSALGVTLGLAARAPLTIFDETYLGMDAPSRYAFYDALLADYIAHPRTIILSSHLISEVEQLFETVTILDHGRLVVSADAEDLRARGTAVTGPADAVHAVTAGRTVLATQRLGATLQVTVDGGLDAAAAAAARRAGVELGPVSLQDLFVHLTSTPTREGS